MPFGLSFKTKILLLNVKDKCMKRDQNRPPAALGKLGFRARRLSHNRQAVHRSPGKAFFDGFQGKSEETSGRL